MVSKNYENKFPHLFREVTWPWEPTRARFMLIEKTPPQDQISNVNIVPRIGTGWVTIQLVDGSWEIPGGTLEPGEDYIQAIRRELMEEAGAQLLSFQVFGAWHCYSLAERPYRPHLPFPEYYRLVGVGEIVIAGQPINPDAGEKVALVEAVPLQTAVARFVSINRHDLAELYQLVSEVYKQD